MRVANINGRLAIRGDSTWIDVEHSSGGRFLADPQGVFERWDEFADWGRERFSGSEAPVGEETLGPPVPAPGQVFAIGLNYRAHALESGFDLPSQPPTFTKFRSCITGPTGRIVLPEGSVDWEVELVVVIGRTAHRVSEDRAWAYVAGLTVGQDLSERQLQHSGPAPQFSLGKSFPGFGPIGPCLVTPDEVADPDDLSLTATLNGEEVQKGRTSDMIFPVPELIARLSAVVTLHPGDLIFTGTPAGVGAGRRPPRFLSPGDELTSAIDGIGQLRHTFVAA
ncbi:fumarylacetoacetate hydrolase family protein [Nocardia sp. R7R-8]|uniref:fumarylacetoacetate hydrolase family protein n=1 Tax=Nocardia sp. R7R-8 TaxID=3459304 RepID=UPI00403D6FB6